MTARSPLAVRRFTLVAVVLPIIVVALSLVVQLAVLPSLPDPVAVHWGLDGSPDRFAPAWSSLLLTLLAGLGLPLLIAASVLGGLRRGDRGFAYRMLGATALGLATLMSVLGAATLAMQAGLADAADGPGVGWALAGALVAGVAAATAGWMLQPHEPFVPSPPLPEAHLALAPTEQVVWLQRVQIARSGAIILGAAVALMVVMTIVTLVAVPDPAASVVLVAVTLVLAALVATTLAFHVRVDATGLSVTSVVGFPRVHIPLSEIEKVAAVDVNPFAEFGGWGLRWVPGGGFGVVLRTGPGIRVERRGERTFTVTVADAATGAAVLEALRARVVEGDARPAPPAA
ncbi:DUF1648 domain-containing protein [Microbacterium telephonicum]|uniref:Uncharacterized protein DUF1648 n=1 Tax=Microbacterium telephonicum TaxID=1714841 RepID=A0A498C0Y9_9MICO|nr:DUF1648 domain-containing protein [Microbacterium telephonicum]RLK48993.1 uncharacterized protein DUF1648 [Microbacterium telephonicum]